MAQINTTVGDFQGNRDAVVGAVQKARQYRPDLIVFPEMALSGYPPEDLLLKDSFIADAERYLMTLLPWSHETVLIVGVPARDAKGARYNAAAVLYRRRCVSLYCKQALPNYGVFDERRYFVPGKENYVYRYGTALFGVNVCEDMWEPGGPHRDQARAGAGLLISISASPYHMRKHRIRRKMISAYARTYNVPVCYVNAVGGQDELVYDGGSFCVDAGGRLRAHAGRFEEDVCLCDIAVPRRRPRTRIADGFPLRMISLGEAEEPRARCRIKTTRAPAYNVREETYRALVLGTRDYVLKNGFTKAVIGLSGGIDSSLAAVIACDALGSDNVIGVVMPSRFSGRATRTDAGRLARALSIKLISAPIEDIFEVFREVLRAPFGGLAWDTTEENIQARIRGVLLMAFSNKFKWMVLTTGNKSETAVGYCTLYGDTAGGFAVLKDVPKTMVYALARYRNGSSGAKPVIPPRVLQRAPTAELRARQKDTDSLPPYDILDPIIRASIEEDLGADDIIRLGYDRDTVKKVISLIDKNEYKRRQAPPGIKITPKAFGRDRRLPITHKYPGVRKPVAAGADYHGAV